MSYYTPPQQLPPPQMPLEKRTRSIVGTMLYVLVIGPLGYVTLKFLLSFLQYGLASGPLHSSDLLEVSLHFYGLGMALVMLWCCRTRATSGEYNLLGILLSLFWLWFLLYRLFLTENLTKAIYQANFIGCFIACFILSIGAFAPLNKLTMLRPMSIVIESSPVAILAHSNSHQQQPPSYTQYSPQPAPVPATAYVYHGGQFIPTTSQSHQSPTYSVQPPPYSPSK